MFCTESPTKTDGSTPHLNNVLITAWIGRSSRTNADCLSVRVETHGQRLNVAQARDLSEVSSRVRTTGRVARGSFSHRAGAPGLSCGTHPAFVRAVPRCGRRPSRDQPHPTHERPSEGDVRFLGTYCRLSRGLWPPCDAAMVVGYESARHGRLDVEVHRLRDPPASSTKHVSRAHLPRFATEGGTRHLYSPRSAVPSTD
jgi:hypothetical protein